MEGQWLSKVESALWPGNKASCIMLKITCKINDNRNTFWEIHSQKNSFVSAGTLKGYIIIAAYSFFL